LRFLCWRIYRFLLLGRFHAFIYYIFSPLLILNISSFGWILLVVIFPTKLVSSYSEFGCSSYCSFGLSCFLPWLWSPETPASFWRILRRVSAGDSGVKTPETPVWGFWVVVVKCDNSQNPESESCRILAGFSGLHRPGRRLRCENPGVSGWAGDSGVYSPETPGTVSSNG
jgi:hypothetical protein